MFVVLSSVVLVVVVSWVGYIVIVRGVCDTSGLAI